MVIFYKDKMIVLNFFDRFAIDLITDFFLVGDKNCVKYLLIERLPMISELLICRKMSVFFFSSLVYLDWPVVQY